jgi:hypothetical protein
LLPPPVEGLNFLSSFLPPLESFGALVAGLASPR